MNVIDVNEAELAQALDVYEAVGDERDKWRILDEEGANRYMRIVQSLEAQAQEASAMMRKEVARVEGFYQAQLDSTEQKAEFFRALIVDYFNRKRAEDPRYQLKTPWGKVSRRVVKTPLWQDEAETLAWLEGAGHDDLVKVEKSIRKAELKKQLNAADGHYIDPATGELVPGVTIVERENVTVKVEV